MTLAAPLPGRKPLSQPEFVALIAMLIATVAFSIDAMLPALPQIAAELSPERPNLAQLIVTSFILGLGVGTFVAGPLSDTLGRRPVVMLGAGIYIIGTLVAWAGDSLELVLAGRILQGFGAAGPRTITIAIVRDMYSGRYMARIMSIAMIIFALVPALAPAVGAGIIALADWRAIFVSFLGFAAISILWFALRQPETLPETARRPLRLRPLLAAMAEVLRHPVVRLSILIQSLLFGALFATISSIQQIFDVTFGRGASFPAWFAGIALVSALASLANAALVVRVGMRRMIATALVAQVGLSGVMTLMTVAGFWSGGVYFAGFVVWATGLFCMAGLTLGNINAIAMEPMGHVAGTAASVIAALSTMLAIVVAVPVGLAFDGTPVPLAGAITLVAGVSLALLRALPR
ncbi:MAG: MFS transporter [Gemmobacter sp.]